MDSASFRCFRWNIAIRFTTVVAIRFDCSSCASVCVCVCVYIRMYVLYVRVSARCGYSHRKTLPNCKLLCIALSDSLKLDARTSFYCRVRVRVMYAVVLCNDKPKTFHFTLLWLLSNVWLCVSNLIQSRSNFSDRAGKFFVNKYGKFKIFHTDKSFSRDQILSMSEHYMEHIRIEKN